MRVVVTRPAPDGERTADALRARGHDVVPAPLMRIEPVAADLAGDFSGVVITSANAPRAIAGNASGERLKSLPVYAVGQRSADAAREFGFANVTSADGDARDLVRLIASSLPGNSSLIYLAGEDRAADLAGDLSARGIMVKTTIVYRAVTAAFPPALIDALRNGAVDAVLHFSRRSADNYLSAARAAGLLEHALSTRHICLSQQIAEPLAAAGATSIEIARSPEENALIDLLGTR